MPENETTASMIKRIRLLLAIFMAGLVLSGATAIPLDTEIHALRQCLQQLGLADASGAAVWLAKIQTALTETNAKFPFLAYGTDWLAFAHFVIAIAFIGPWRDPVKNVWVIEFGMIACLLVVPFALGVGAVRGIPFGWRLIDCSFGVGGIIPLWLCRQEIKKLAPMAAAEKSSKESPAGVSL
jgi:hypothetical protein